MINGHVISSPSLRFINLCPSLVSIVINAIDSTVKFAVFGDKLTDKRLTDKRHQELEVIIA